MPKTIAAAPAASTVPTHLEIANLPLLQPFRTVTFPNPESTQLIQALHTEQEVANVVELYRNRVTTLREERSKLISEAEKSAKDHKDQQSANNSNSSSGATGGNANKSQKLKKKDNKPKLSQQVQSKLKQMDNEIRNNDDMASRYQQELLLHTQYTRGIFQMAYTKIAMRLETQNATAATIDALEESFAFFCPRQTIQSNIINNQDQELWDDSQRVAYVREMCPVMRAHHRPSSAGLFSLPYVTKFQCTPETSGVVMAILDELYQKTITEEMKTRMKDVTDEAKLKVLRHCEDMLEKKTELTTELVRKHYRKKSIRLHPDRNGEETRPIFEEFTDARDVFANVELRQLYMTQMLDVFSKIGPDHIEIAHEAWNKKHRPDAAEQANGSRKREDKKDGAPLQIEGTLNLSQTQKGVMVTKYNRGKGETFKIDVYALEPRYEFYGKVRNIRVDLKSSRNERRSFTIQRREIISNIQLDCHRQPILRQLVTVKETELNPGLWEFVAHIQLDPIGSDIMNPVNATGEVIQLKPSSLTTFNVVDRAFQKMVEEFATTEQRCINVHAALSAVVRQLRASGGSSQSALERYGKFHKVLVRARQLYDALEAKMERSGLKSNIYHRLGSLLQESRQLFAEMENTANSVAKKKLNKNDAKRFKTYVATVLESNKPSTWMKNVSKAELCRNGGSPDPINRLYQLFIEGKGKYTLLFDSEMYKVAAVRDDLFSTNQCRKLATRGEEVCRREKEEEEAAIAAEEKKKKEEEEQAKMLKDIEMRHKWGMVGQNILIKGLTSAKGKEMNNLFARVLNYVVEKDRFEVEMLSTKAKALLKIDNMDVYYGYIPDEPAPTRQTETKVESSAASTSTNTSKNSGSKKNKPRKAEKEPQASQKATPKPDTTKMSKTVYVVSSYSKSLTGKKGRKKKDLVERSGANISVKTFVVNNFVAVDLNGTATAVWKAFALIQEAVGPENVSEVEPSPPPPPKQTAPKAQAPPVSERPPFCPTSTFQAISVPEAESNMSRQLEKSLEKGMRGVSATPETLMSSPNYSFGEELLVSKPAELPSEIGIEGLNLPKKSSNDPSIGSVSSLNDRSIASRAPSISPAVKNDQLLSFLKSQHQCIKGSVEDFCSWLVKSEDIDSISALKEAVVDEDYLNETLKVGNGESGMKGFKRKAFQRAVLDYQEPPQQVVTVAQAQPYSGVPPLNNKGGINDELDSDKRSLGMSTLESAFLPSNLFATPRRETVDPPPELLCPIELVLMTTDPVLAADGVTYERRAITNWFKANIAKIKKAEEALKINPFSDSDRRILETGITSPALGTKMTSLYLTENINVRNMARDFQNAEAAA